MRADIEAVLQFPRHSTHRAIYRLVVIPVFAFSKHGVFAIVVVIQRRAAAPTDKYLCPDATLRRNDPMGSSIDPTVWSQM